jgi:enoyl-CoA hydratase/carnithine racemase
MTVGRSASRPVRCETDGLVATIVIDNPPVNALSVETLMALDDAVTDVADTDVRAVVITGTGTKPFAAGADISDFPRLLADPEAMRKQVDWASGIMDRVAGLKQPVIAAVQGHAVGGGLELALCCDFIIADASVRLGLTEVKLALIPGAGGTQRLPRRIGQARAKDLLLRGRLLTAAEAYEWGLVSAVAVEGEALADAMALARELAERPGRAVQALKALVDSDLELDAGLAFERSQFMAVFGTADAGEGYRAFLEKRPPNFVHH